MVEFTRAVLSGTLASGAEIWSCGMNFVSETDTPIVLPVDLNVWAANIDIQMDTTLAGALGSALSSQGRLTGISTYYYPSAVGPAQSVGGFTTSTSGLSTARNPLQTSVVGSLRTPLSGRSYRGRMYWPMIGTTVETTGRISGATAQALATAFVDLLEGVAGASPVFANLAPAVISATRDEGTLVTSVDVGDVPDTQRRRSQGLVDTRYTVALS